MKYKLTEDGKAIELKDGKPVVIDDDGKEFTIDALSASEKVSAANAEARKYRKEAKDAKDLAETESAKVLEQVGKEAAEDAKSKLEAAGATVALT